MTQSRVADALGIDTFIPVGYSMGGPVAQLIWQRHRGRVDALVLCATAPYFAGRRPERLSFLGSPAWLHSRASRRSQARGWITDQVYLQRKSQTWSDWAIEQVIASTTGGWCSRRGGQSGSSRRPTGSHDIDVPTSVVITMRDQVVPLRRQVKLFEWIPGAEAFRVDGEHDSVVARPTSSSRSWCGRSSRWWPGSAEPVRAQPPADRPAAPVASPGMPRPARVPSQRLPPSRPCSSRAEAAVTARMQIRPRPPLLLWRATRRRRRPRHPCRTRRPPSARTFPTRPTIRSTPMPQTLRPCTMPTALVGAADPNGRRARAAGRRHGHRRLHGRAVRDRRDVRHQLPARYSARFRARAGRGDRRLGPGPGRLPGGRRRQARRPCRPGLRRHPAERRHPARRRARRS